MVSDPVELEWRGVYVVLSLYSVYLGIWSPCIYIGLETSWPELLGPVRLPIFGGGDADAVLRLLYTATGPKHECCIIEGFGIDSLPLNAIVETLSPFWSFLRPWVLFDINIPLTSGSAKSQSCSVLKESLIRHLHNSSVKCIHGYKIASKHKVGKRV